MDAFSKVYAEAVSQESRLSKGDVKAPSDVAVTSQSSEPSLVPPSVVEPQAPDASTAVQQENTMVNSVVATSTMGTMPAPTHADSVKWEPAVARTWVNVRSDASRGGDVVGVIKPDEKAMLGVDRYGWRQVRLQDVSGWVDPRLFESDSTRTRG